jgi:hypothetical protein
MQEEAGWKASLRAAFAPPVMNAVKCKGRGRGGVDSDCRVLLLLLLLLLLLSLLLLLLLSLLLLLLLLSLLFLLLNDVLEWRAVTTINIGLRQSADPNALPRR